MLLAAQNYVSHLGVYRAALVREVGGFREGVEGAQDWDLLLRCAERVPPSAIRHIPQDPLPLARERGVDRAVDGEQELRGAAQERVVARRSRGAASTGSFAAWRSGPSSRSTCGRRARPACRWCF